MKCQTGHQVRFSVCCSDSLTRGTLVKLWFKETSNILPASQNIRFVSLLQSLQEYTSSLFYH